MGLKKQRVQSWVGGEGELDLGGVGGEGRSIKTCCTKSKKLVNIYILKTKQNCTLIPSCMPWNMCTHRQTVAKVQGT